MQFRYSHKLLFLVAFFMVLGIAITAYYNITMERKLIEKIALDEASTMNRTVFEAIYTSMKHGGGRKENRAIVESLSKELKGVSNIRLIHGPGIDKQYGKELDETPIDSLDESGLAGNEITDIKRNGTRSARFVKPFFLKKECLGCHIGNIGDVNGAISVTVSLAEYDKIVASDARNTAIAGFFILIISLAAASFFIFHVSIRPINELSRAVHKIGSGDLDYRINLRDGLEINQLVEDFNSMAEKLKKRNDELHLLNKKLEKMSITDGLTSTFNHKHFYTLLDEEIIRSTRYNKEFSVILLDVDHFKHYNDTNGHQNGDVALKGVAECLKSALRSTDILARYGGEEFSIILAETDKHNALNLAERIRSLVEKHPFPYEEKQPLGKLTVSIGVSSFPKDSRKNYDLVSKADQALYKAKDTGRNKVVAAE